MTHSIWDSVAKVNGAINSVVWGVPFLVLIVGVGLYLSIRGGFKQFTRFGYVMKNTMGKMFEKHETKQGEVTPFQAVCTALSATVGTGNISGVTAAVTLGGAGSIFWLWVTALIGMFTKYAEVLLSVRFREKNDKGDWVGGPMYYIRNGLGKNWNWLACLFCIFGALAAFGIGNAVQTGNIIDSIDNAINVFGGNTMAHTFSFMGRDVPIVNLILGIIIAIIVAVTLLGGIQRLGRVAERLVPFMAALFIICSLVVIIANIKYIGVVFGMIFKGAFNPQAVTGGVAGLTVKSCITWGVKRGVFSNEAGLGSAPIAHAGSCEENPVKQGLYGIFEVFMDSIVICTMTGLTLLIAAASGGIDITYGIKGGIDLNAAAFGTVFGPKFGALVIAVGIVLFALSTILSWGLYGSRCCEYLLGTKSIKVYQVIFVLITIVACTMDLTLAWDIADTLNGLMAIPNLVGLLGLSGVVIKLTKEHFSKRPLE